jgi:hypothetical protein
VLSVALSLSQEKLDRQTLNATFKRSTFKVPGPDTRRTRLLSESLQLMHPSQILHLSRAAHSISCRSFTTEYAVIFSGVLRADRVAGGTPQVAIKCFTCLLWLHVEQNFCNQSARSGCKVVSFTEKFELAGGDLSVSRLEAVTSLACTL